MGTFMVLMVIVAALWGLAFFGAPLIAWVASIAFILIALQYSGAIFWLSFLLWPLFIIGFLPFLMPHLRVKYFTTRIFDFVRKTLPHMSQTEREAIEAGNVWWEGKFFQGRPDWKGWLALPKQGLTAEEQSFLDNQVEKLLDMTDDWDILHSSHNLSPEVWDYIKSEKFFGMIIPKKFGGLEFSALAHSAILAKIGTKSIPTAVSVMVPNSLGPAELLLKYGTEEQKSYYLPRLANGTEIPCFALTSPHAGSDAGSIQDHGVVCKGIFRGKETLGIKLSWNKRYITLAPIATVLGVAFKLYDPEHLIGTVDDIGITLCLIPTDTHGVEIGKRHNPLGMAFMNGPTRGTDVFVPLDWIIGGQEMGGQGWRMLMECLSAGRGISLPALSAASAMVCYRMTGAYAALREQFRVPIGHFEGVQAPLARMGAFTYIIEATRIMTAISLDLGEKPPIATAIAKYHITELGRQSVYDAMDIHGGKAIMLGPNNYLAALYRAQPISITVEGANILTRSLMIFGQGAIRCHPYIQKEMQAIELYETEPERALESFDKTIWEHFRYLVKNKARVFLYGITLGFAAIPPKRDFMSRYFQKLTWMSSALAFSSDISMIVLGGKLKKSEQLSARLGDVLSHIYLSGCVLKYYYDQGENEADRSHVEWALQYSLNESQRAFDDLLSNFPIKSIGWALRLTMFPFGSHCRAPSDRLNEKVALQVMEDSELRNRLTPYVAFSSLSTEGVTGVELAFKKLQEVRPTLVKIQQAIHDKELPKNLSQSELLKEALQRGIIDAHERETVLQFEKLRSHAIAVDEFTENQFVGKVNQWNIKNTMAKTDRFS